MATASAAAPEGAKPAHGFDWDLFCIGAGSGGVRASRMSASYGAKVAVCELPYAAVSSDDLGGAGGTCVIRGCVPKKLLVFASAFAHEFTDSHGFGWAPIPQPPHDWAQLIAAKNKEVQRLSGVYGRILGNAGVTARSALFRLARALSRRLAVPGRPRPHPGRAHG